MGELFSAKGLLILLILGILLALPVIFWRARAVGKDNELAEVLRQWEIPNPHRDLQGKTWTEEELATIEVVALAGGFGREQAISRSIQNRDALIPAQQYEFQGIVTDFATGRKHVFGKRRSEPRRWVWVTMHPDSTREMIEQLRQEQATYGRAVSPH